MPDRSPIAYVHLCPACGGYEPFTPEDYYGALSGCCQGCGSEHRELHRFPAVIDSARECACTKMHSRVTGNLSAGSERVRLAADLRTRAGELEAMPANDTSHERDHLLFAAGMRRAVDLIELGDFPAERVSGNA